MSIAAEIINNIVPVSDFSRGKAAQAFSKAADGSPVLVLKNNAPLAIITSPDEYSRLIQIEEDYYLLNEALERLSKNEGVKTHSLEEVMAELGIDDKDLDSLGEVEFE